MWETKERIYLRIDGVSWLRGRKGRIPFSPQAVCCSCSHISKGEAMDLGVLASETILETETALCINSLMGRGAVLIL